MKDSRNLTCLAFRRAKLADPARLPAPAATHLDHCPSCRAFGQRIDAQANRIADCLEVPVPEGLADRVLLTVHARGKERRRWGLALAASVALGCALLFRFAANEAPPDYARYAIRHVLAEADDAPAPGLDPAGFGTVLASFGGELRGPLGTVRVLKLCPVPDGTGWHVVLDSPHGEVTLLLIPSRRGAPGKSLAGRERGLSAVARRLGGGYVAIVGPDDATVQAVEALLSERVRWRT